jgi:DNA-binding Xre family transcriptional regulator
LSIQDESFPRIIIRLRAVLAAHSERTGERLTYARLAERTGISRATIESIATRRGYNATLDIIARLCGVLNCTPSELLELESPPTRRRRRRAP